MVFSDDESATLQQRMRRRPTAQATAMRAGIILAASTGATYTAIAGKLGFVIPIERIRERMRARERHEEPG